MLLRQVQARPLQGHHLRALRRRGDAAEGAPRADGPHRPGRARLAHLVLQGRAEPHRLPARHRPARAREGALLRRLDRHGASTTRSGREGPERPRGQGQGRVRAHRRRPRRGARRARGPPHAPPRLLREGQGPELRRGRRLLGPRPLQLGRGAGAARRSRTLAGSSSRIFVELAQQITTEDSKKIRELVRRRRDPRRPQAHPARARARRDRRGADPRGARPAPRASSRRRPARRRARSRSTCNKIIGRAARRRRARGRRRGARRGRRREEPREGARPRQRPARATCSTRPSPTSTRGIRELANDLCLDRRAIHKEDLDAIVAVGAEGARDVPRHRVAPRGRARGRRRLACAGSSRRGSSSAISSRR